MEELTDWTHLDSFSTWHAQLLLEDPRVELRLYPDGYDSAGVRAGERYTLDGTLALIAMSLGMLSRDYKEYSRVLWTSLASLQAIVSHERKRLYGPYTQQIQDWEMEG